MTYAINTGTDLENYSFDDLESFIKADEFNALLGRDRIINPALNLELVYEPIGYVFNSEA
ncbi:hypothetical protein [Streptosporangium sp. NPDC087985]|uniref:hypothetical protein n=1 Tax=Streptosporangium sp. NPDC087985 TaxID=3366196 RepID=UPI00380271B4